jgi:RNA polymerase sigma-70 factor (ECF subfamily)
MYLVSGMMLQKWQALTDEQLVRHVLIGRTALYEVLMRRHAERLFRAIRAVIGSDKQAEVLLEETFLHAYSHLRHVPATTKFATWITRIANDRATHARRSLESSHPSGPAPDGLSARQLKRAEPVVSPFCSS